MEISRAREPSRRHTMDSKKKKKTATAQQYEQTCNQERCATPQCCGPQWHTSGTDPTFESTRLVYPFGAAKSPRDKMSFHKSQRNKTLDSPAFAVHVTIDIFSPAPQRFQANPSAFKLEELPLHSILTSTPKMASKTVDHTFVW